MTTYTLVRNQFIGDITFGILKGIIAAPIYTIEDKDRGLNQSMPLEEIKKIKVHSQTCIPYGCYEVKMTFSPKYMKVLPQLMNVPGFEGIRIHSGNTIFDTEGCIIPGLKKAVDRVTESRLAMQHIINALTDDLKRGKVYLQIVKQS